MLKSIRWQLPLSYAAIALLAALALGAVLLLTLRSYYMGQELAYLSSNAGRISQEMARMRQADLPPAAIQAQLKNFSFLSQARVRLLDPEEQPLADSGEPVARPQVAALSVEVTANGPASADVLTQPATGTFFKAIPGKAYASFIYIQRPDLEISPGQSLITHTLVVTRSDGAVDILPWQMDLTTPGTQVITGEMNRAEVVQLAELPPGVPPPPDFISIVPAIGTPYGFGLSSEIDLTGPRSEQLVSQPFYDTGGKLLGYAELSQGPAYGREILTSVAWGWAIAGGVAVVVAAGVGWLVSRRLSAPLLALTDVTGRMAQGNLSARAEVTRPAPAEVGVLARSFNEMAEQVEETVLTLRRFVADAAHELHTPLTALRTNLELIAGESGPHAHLEQAQAQVERLETLTRDLLDLSRLESGAGQANFGPVDLKRLVHETSERYASQAEQAGLAFALETPEQPVIVQGNESQLRRALGNLLDNTLKFTPPGGSIRVGLRPLAGEGQVELWVEDTGIGIPPGDVPHLFNRFHRGRNATAYRGSGLGLAIVKAIAERHRGQVMVEHQRQGACFRLRLPLA